MKHTIVCAGGDRLIVQPSRINPGMVSVQVESAGRVLRCSIEVEAAGAVVLADAFSDCATSADLKAALSMGGA